MISFLDALIPLADAFDALRVPYYIGGSVASIAHGVPRTTLDVDVIADFRIEQVRPFVAQLQEQYFVQAATMIQVASGARSVSDMLGAGGQLVTGTVELRTVQAN